MPASTASDTLESAWVNSARLPASTAASSAATATVPAIVSGVRRRRENSTSRRPNGRKLCSS